MTTTMSPGRRAVAVTSAAALTFLGLVSTPASAATTPIAIDIATVNDFHGRIVTSGQSAGAPVLKCALDAMTATNPNSVFVAAGDLIGATTFESAVAQDKPTIDVMNLLGLKTSALGNHEFDKGQDDLNNRVIPAAQWTYTSANIYRNGQPAYPQYNLVDVGGVKVAFIGATTPELPSLVSPSGIAGLEVRPMLPEVNKVVTALTDGNPANGEADVLIALVHDGAPSPTLSSANGTAYGDLINGINPKVSAILSGHTHQLYAQQVNGVWVMQSAQYGEQLGRVSISYDPDTKKATVTRAWNVDLVSSTGVPVCTPDATMKAFVDNALKQADILGAVPIGKVGADFRRAVQADGTENRGGESVIGNFVADVQLWAAKKAGDVDLAVMNPGGIRTDIMYPQSGTEGDGIVTYKEAAMVQPFANTIMTTQLTGAQLKTLLEQQWQPASSSRPFLKLGISKGFHYLFDPAAAKGERITSMTLNGKPVELTKSYTVAANSFLMSGGDNFTELAKGTQPVDTGWVDLDGMVEYFKANYPATGAGAMPDYAQRAVGVTVTSGADKGYKVGDTVTLHLSSLAFSRAEPKPTAVQVSVGKVDFGSFKVDNAIVSTTDLAGQADVTFKIPQRLVAMYATGRPVPVTISLSDDVSGWLAEVPLKLDSGKPVPPPFR